MAGLIGVGIYFLPSLIAVARHTHNTTGIFLLNLLLGWTGIGWIIAFIMAIASSPYYYHPYCYAPPPPPRHWY
ncbi:MAG: superinfection immunity protein [Acidobacteriaceae bacterium]